MTIAEFFDNTFLLNLAPQEGVAAGGTFLDIDYDNNGGSGSYSQVDVVIESDGTTTTTTSTNTTGSASPEGGRNIVWYGSHAAELNAGGVGTARNPINGNGFALTGTVQIGWLVTYSVDEATPAAPGPNDDFKAYVFQVACQLGAALKTVPIYAP